MGSEKLGNIATFFSGGTPNTSIPQYYIGNIPFIKSGEIHQSCTKQYISQDAILNSSAKLVNKGDLLYALYGATSGECTISQIDGAINQAILCIRTDENTKFILSVLQMNKQHYINSYLQGGQGNLSAEIVKTYQIKLPPLPEQQKIAEILSVWDHAIEKQTKLIEKLETRKRALMQQLLTGKKRLKGFDGEIKYKSLKPYIRELAERNKNNNITMVLSVTNSRGFIKQDEQFDRAVASNNLTNYKIIKEGQFAYNPSRVNVGSLDLLKTFEQGILSPMYIVFSTDETKLKSDFLYYHLKSDWFKNHIPMYVQGSVRDSLSFEGLCAMKFFIPPITEQTAIAEILSSANREINLAKKKLSNLKEQKKGLMQVLLTGKKRVKINKIS